MAGDEHPRTSQAAGIPEAIVGLGAVLLILQPASQVLLYGVGILLYPPELLGLAITALFAIPLMYGGYWLRRSDVDPDRYPRVAVWCAVVMVGFLAVNLVMIAAWPADALGENVGWAVSAAAMGATAGTLFGSIEARSIERAVEAERATMRSAQLESQREWLEYLNSLLRHEVLNTANVITGYAELLIEGHDGDERRREHLERIARQSRKMTDVIQDVRLLIQATNGDARFETVDVVAVLRKEVTAIEDRHGEVTVTTSMPESAIVTADDLLARVFSNLLENAVLHNDSEAPHVEVGVEAGPDAVAVSVADDGPGVPESERDSLFERTGRGDHGLGLYLVSTLLARYDGSIELAETGAEGSTFVVELPRGTPERATPEGDRPIAADAT